MVLELVVPKLVVRELVDREPHIGPKIFSALRADTLIESNRIKWNRIESNRIE